MGDAFQAQKRYFETHLEQCKKKPGLHQHVIRDCEHYLKALEEAGSPVGFKAFVQRTGNMVSTGKAEVLDRCENRAFIYQKLGLEKKLRGEEGRHEVIEKAKTHQDLARNLEEFERSHAWELQENKAIMGALQVLRAVFHLATDPQGSTTRDITLASFRQYWDLLRETDPEISWKKLTTYRPYRDRMIFTDSQLAALQPFFEEARNGHHR